MEEMRPSPSVGSGMPPWTQNTWRGIKRVSRWAREGGGWEEGEGKEERERKNGSLHCLAKKEGDILVREQKDGF